MVIIGSGGGGNKYGEADYQYHQSYVSSQLVLSSKLRILPRIFYQNHEGGGNIHTYIHGPTSLSHVHTKLYAHLFTNTMRGRHICIQTSEMFSSKLKLFRRLSKHPHTGLRHLQASRTSHEDINVDKLSNEMKRHKVSNSKYVHTCNITNN